MIESMYEVMQRIDDIKKRFGLMRHNTPGGAEGTGIQSLARGAGSAESFEAVRARIDAANGNPSVDDINAVADYFSDKRGLPREVTRAVIEAESGYKTDAVSKKGARGLMQLMPSVMRDYGVENPFDPIENISAGTGLLGTLIKSYGGDLKKALAAYNAGKATVDRHGGVPDYPETKNYIEKVIHRIKSSR